MSRPAPLIAGPAPAVARPRALLSMDSALLAPLFGDDGLARLRTAYTVETLTAPGRELGALPDEVLAEAEVLVTGWGSGTVDDALLARTPRLQAVLHAGGAVGHVHPQAWARGVRVVGSADQNALPVAEYAAAMILLSVRQVLRSQVLYRSTRAFVDREQAFGSAGSHGATVGLVGASRTGRHVVTLLAPTDLDVVVFDPHLDDAAAAAMGVRAVGLDELMSTSTVVSLHAPLLPSTEGMIGPGQLSLMPEGATLVNTARGGLVDHGALEAELVSGRLWAVLDTTDPWEPLPPASPLWDLPNVVLTPHVAGSMGNEIRRLGDHVVAQALRLAAGLPLDGEVPPPGPAA